ATEQLTVQPMTAADGDSAEQRRVPARYDIKLALSRSGDVLRGSLDVRLGVLDSAGAARLIGHLRAALSALCREPERALSALVERQDSRAAAQLQQARRTRLDRKALRGRRRAVALDSDQLVRVEPPSGDSRSERSLPLRLSPTRSGVRLDTWLRSRRAWLDRHLEQHGATLWRGFALGDPAALEAVMEAVAEKGGALDYVYRSTPRSAVSGRVFTSTEYPPDRDIPLHNELAYHRSWPRKLGFLCLVPAARGGATPIADSRRVYARIPEAVRERFAALGVTYVRNYGGPLDLDWRDVFQTEARDEVAVYCRDHGIEYEWLGDDRLRTRQTCQAVATHPATGAAVWFNQAHLFHVSALGREAHADLLRTCGADGLPRTCVYGDGTDIEPDTIAVIRDAYRAEAVRFTWQAGDLLLLDNMLVAHGRDPFAGERRVVVCMADSHSAPEQRAEVQS
ncbi:MAG: TauD/TfdA family dioxygenase, partial [Myxococcota bacterium]